MLADPSSTADNTSASHRSRRSSKSPCAPGRRDPTARTAAVTRADLVFLELVSWTEELWPCVARRGNRVSADFYGCRSSTESSRPIRLAPHLRRHVVGTVSRSSTPNGGRSDSAGPPADPPTASLARETALACGARAQRLHRVGEGDIVVPRRPGVGPGGLVPA